MLAKEACNALEERYDNVPPGTLFLLRAKHFNRDFPFTTFDAAIKFLSEHEKTEDNVDRMGFVWYKIEKWLPGEDGNMDACFSWTLNTDGDICDFDYAIDYGK